MGVAGAGIPDGVAARARLYRGLLASRRVLVLLDNAAGEAQVRPPAARHARLRRAGHQPPPTRGLEASVAVDLDVLPLNNSSPRLHAPGAKQPQVDARDGPRSQQPEEGWMHRRILYRLTFLAAAMSLGHHIDHLIRGNAVGWPWAWSDDPAHGSTAIVAVAGAGPAVAAAA
jgi:hypothetical protein